MKSMISSVTVKLILLGGLVLVLWVPTGWIYLLVEERADARDAARAEVGATWGGRQQVVGPLLVVPATVLESRQRNGIQETRECEVEIVLLPEQLSVTGDMAPEVRARSIYEVVLYRTRLELAGSFDPAAAAGLGVTPDAIRWQEARLVVGVSDLRGLREVPRLEWGGDELPLREPGQRLGFATVATRAPLAAGGAVDFTLQLLLDGSDELMLTPVGRETAARLSSSWPHPSFAGAFLPSDRVLRDDGFEARWQVLDLNRRYPQAWRSDRADGVAAAVADSAFGLRVLFPVDAYQRTTRAVKYSLLFTALTLLAVFVVDHGLRQGLHPAQYLLVGCALVVFYLLLLSLGEVLGFAAAYGTAALVVVGLVVAYARAVFDRRAAVVAVGGVLVALYGCLFVMLHLEDLALLTGSVLLVVALAVMMWLTRRLHRGDGPAAAPE